MSVGPALERQEHGKKLLRVVIGVLGQADYELRLVIEAARQPRTCLVSWLMLLIGLGYLVGPVDFISGKTPYVGHLDEAAFLVGGIALARHLLPDSLRCRAERSRSGRPLSTRLRGRTLQCGAALLGAPVLRLCLGRWPDRREKDLFSSGFVSGEAVLPPILRGLHSVPAAKEPLGNLAVLNLVREGVVRKPADLGAVRMPMPPQPGNPLSYWRGQPLSFLHFEKAAGTSLANLMTGLFHPLQIDDDPERGTAPHVLSAFPPFKAAELGRKHLVWGHYDLPALRRLDPGRTVITALRRPRDRILSLYDFWRAVDPQLIAGGLVGFNVRAAHELDLLAFLRSDDPLIRNYIDNVYVRRLVGVYDVARGDDALCEEPLVCLEKALVALNSIAFVGIVEKMELSLPLLGTLVGAKLPARLPSRNVAEEYRSGLTPGFRRVDRSRLTSSIEEELQRLTRLDELVYEAALGRLWADVGLRDPDG